MSFIPVRKNKGNRNFREKFKNQIKYPQSNMDQINYDFELIGRV